uniref:Uncharacterized protein n=1 Tax=Panagrolaimus sp. JU765 TaxID=591449 RepID=A0AC34QN60_9BILA
MQILQNFQESKRLSRKRRYSPPKWFKGEINEYNEIDPGRDLSEPKRFKFIPNSLPENFFPDECDPDNIPLNIIDDHPVSFSCINFEKRAN